MAAPSRPPSPTVVLFLSGKKVPIDTRLHEAWGIALGSLRHELVTCRAYQVSVLSLHGHFYLWTSMRWETY
jgi:hypothetical protein